MSFCQPKTNIKNYLAVSQRDETEAEAAGAPSSQTMDEVKGLPGGGKGHGSVYFTKGLPILEDDNLCRHRCMCVDGGCRKLDLKFQWFCIKIDLD